ncbi:MAG: hypothetical protein HQK96_13060 [Nitrospirae bacterium]|nr:hypothetical protein [Nitrospirota bacterium]
MVHDISGEPFVDRVKNIMAYSRPFMLNPHQWRKYSHPLKLSWSFVKFEDNNKITVPEERGVYAFVVRHVNDYFPHHGFIMYVGIAGKRGTKRTLRDRFLEYIVERTQNKRPAVHFMLNAYKEDLFFYYVPVSDTAVELEPLETALNDAILPPVSKMDFSAEMRAMKGAFY